jgi:hypothetical protein
MKSMLTKFKISTALDSGKPLPDSLRQKIAADPELERFANRAQSLGRPSASGITMPGDPSLHDSIMRAVRAAGQREEPRRAPVFSWLAASATVAALALVCLWMALPHPSASLRPAPLGGLAQVIKRAVTGAVFP